MTKERPCRSTPSYSYPLEGVDYESALSRRNAALSLLKSGQGMAVKASTAHTNIVLCSIQVTFRGAIVGTSLGRRAFFYRLSRAR